MKTMIKPITSLTSLTLFALALTCDTSVASEPGRSAADKEIRACISEVSRNADYADASRVVHWIIELEQKNLEELEIRIETAVFRDKQDIATHNYEASCVTGPLGKLVSFRIHQTPKKG